MGKTSIQLLRQDAEQGRSAVTARQQELQKLLDSKAAAHARGDPDAGWQYDPAIDAARSALQHEEANQRDRDQTLGTAVAESRAQLALYVAVGSVLVTALSSLVQLIKLFVMGHK